MRTSQEVTKGERWALLATIISNVGQLFLLLAFTRLVSREAFAVMAIANVAIGIPQLILQTGLSHSLFSQAENDQEQLSTLFWLHLIFALSGSGLVILAALPISDFYGGPFLKETIWLLSFTLVFEAIAALYRVLLLKELNYSFLARVDIVAFVASGVTAFFLAFSGYGVFALVAQVAARAVLRYLLLFSEGRQLFFPSLQFNLASVKSHLNFAFSHIGERLSMWMATQVDVLLIGKLLGMEMLGVYEVFRRLLNRPPAALGEMMERIALPLMARFKKRSIILKRIYLSNIKLMVIMVFPIYGFIALFSKELVPFLFGPFWKSHAPVFSFIALAIAFQSVGHPLDNLLVAVGTIRRLLFWNLTFLPIHISLIWVGASRGLYGVTLLLFFSAVFISNPAYFLLLKQEILLGFREFLYPIFQVIGMVLLSSIIPAVLVFGTAYLWSLLWAAGFFLLVYLLLTWWFLPSIWLWILKFASFWKVN